MQIRASHIVAALLGIALIAWGRMDPTFPMQGHDLPTVFWVAALFIFGWECILRAFRLVHRLLTGETTEYWSWGERR